MGFFSSIGKAVGGILGGGSQQAPTVATTRPFDIGTPISTGALTPGGQITTGLSSDLARILTEQGGLALGGGFGREQIAGNLGSILGLVPSQIGEGQLLQMEARQITPQTEFEQLQALLQPGQQRQRSALESRLFAQGRLGTTGGTEVQEAQEEAFEQNRLAAAVQATQSARAQQAALRGQAQNALQSALGLSQGGIGGISALDALRTNALQNILGIQSGILQPLTVGGALQGAAAAPVRPSGLGTVLGGALGGFLGGTPGATAGAGIGGALNL